MDHHLNDTVEYDSFLNIKKSLDPSGTHIIFEHDISQGQDSILSNDLNIYRYLKKEHLKWRKFIDNDRVCEYLVIETSLGTEERILGKMMGYSFSDHIVYYLYNKKS